MADFPIAPAPPLRATPLLQQRPFRMLSYTRFFSRVAQNSLNFGLLLLIVDETGRAFFSSLLVLALVVPSTAAGIAAGALADSLPKRLLIVLGDLLRVSVCAFVVWWGPGVAVYFVVAVAFAVTTQIATSAEGAALPAIVERHELARANAIGHAVGGVAQIVGFGILTPIVLRVFESPTTLFAIAAVLFFIASVQAVMIGPVRGGERLEVGGEHDAPWWKVGWNQLRSDSFVWHASIELTLIQMTVIIVGGLIPTYIDEVLDLPIEIGVIVLMPAAIGITLGLRVAGFLAKRIPHAILSTTGFASFVVLLAMVAFVPQEARFFAGYPYLGWLDDISIGSFGGAAILAMILVMPLGFAYAVVVVAGQTVLNDRVPLSLQGRVLATQAAMSALAASVPVLIAGALGDWLGVQPVLALLSAIAGGAAAINVRENRKARRLASARPAHVR
ncbi:MAG: hypothetical protein Kow0010_02250 [Dehalococcoidia bacterium]